MPLSDQFSESLGPILSSNIMHVLLGLVILVVGLVVVKFVTNLFRALLSKSSFLNTNDLIRPVTSLIKAVLTIFVLIAVLQHFGLTSVLEPLENLVNQFLSAIPRIVGASIVGYVGWVLAKIVSGFVAVTCERFDQQFVKRTGGKEIKISKFVSAFVFGGILLPIVVAALGILDIPAITNPASNMINELMGAVPNIVGAGIILIVSYVIAKFVVFMLSGLLAGMHVDTLPAKLQLEGLFSPKFTLTNLIGNSIIFFTMVTAAIAAVDTLEIEIVSIIFSKVLEFGGNILVGCLILVIGNVIGTVAYQKIAASGGKVLAQIARVAILGLVLAMGLKAMGLADNIVNMAFGFTIGSAAVAFALAFGLGGRDAAKTVADRWVNKIK